MQMKVTMEFIFVNSGVFFEVMIQPYKHAVISGMTSLFLSIVRKTLLVVAMVTIVTVLVPSLPMTPVPVWL